MEKKTIIKYVVLIVLLLACAIGAGATTVFVLTQMAKEEQAAEIAETTPEGEATEVEPEQTGPLLINFQQTVEAWAKSISGNASVMITDLDNDKVVADYKSQESFPTASIYKLFVTYEGYKRIANGEWNKDDNTAYIGADHKEYNTPVSTEGKTHYSKYDCLDLAIRESYSPCAEILLSEIGAGNLDTVIKDTYDIQNTSVSGYTTTPQDVTKIMKMFYEHKDWNDEIQEKVLDSFLNQPVTTYDWRQGLPSGFSENVKVYNKVGWDANGPNWTLFHDAAIIEVKGHHYIVVVMTNNVNPEDNADLAIKIETNINGAEENYAALQAAKEQSKTESSEE